MLFGVVLTLHYSFALRCKVVITISAGSVKFCSELPYYYWLPSLNEFGLLNMFACANLDKQKLDGERKQIPDVHSFTM